MAEENQTIYCAHAGPIPLEVERKIQSNNYEGELFNDYGFVIRAKAEKGEDIHLWPIIYQQQGDEAVNSGDVCQILVIYGKFSDNEKKFMHPNCSTVNKGQNIEDYFSPGSIKWTETEQDVKVGAWRPNSLGRSSRVACLWRSCWSEVECSFHPDNPAFYHCGRFEDAKTPVAKAGYIVHTRVSGTIEVHGKALVIKDGFGIHERIKQHGKVADRTLFMSGRGLHWKHAFSEGFTWYLMRRDIGRGMSSAMINIGDRQIFLEDPTSSGVEEVAHWVDPESRILSPYKWKIWIRTEQGTHESLIHAYGQQYYTWIRRNETLVVNQYCADAETIFKYLDGRVLGFQQMISIEHMRTLYRQTAN
ncbi:hypothetical protein N7520_003230 [Penicillium odoratum]|uniref:uncharacterized protein n=1 Tax=Penicillium odoratum TaxID=1167516 RepID=UPI0025497C7E|nr:uncharacterized protein N7520_003230 [Penicillium odoratum]KAJ5772701.1 hypothetical protein N7520_003230 [Penicillium odoratum]